MSVLSIDELNTEQRNEYGMPVGTDPVMMGANDMSTLRRERRRICDELDAARINRSADAEMAGANDLTRNHAQETADWVRQTANEARSPVDSWWFLSAVGVIALVSIITMIWEVSP